MPKKEKEQELGSYEEKIRELKREEIKAKIDYYKSLRHRLIDEVLRAETFERVNLIDLKNGVRQAYSGA